MGPTSSSDYALCTLLHLATNPGRTVPISEMPRHYKSSRNHVATVGSEHVQMSLLSSTRGLAGGVQLALPSKEIRPGQIICSAEPITKLIDFLDCVAPVCDFPKIDIELIAGGQPPVTTLPAGTAGDGGRVLA